MLPQLTMLIGLLKRAPQGTGLPQPDAEALDEVQEALSEVVDDPRWQAAVVALAGADPSKPESIVPALVNVHLRLESLTTPLLDLHDEVKRLISEYPQIDE